MDEEPVPIGDLIDSVFGRVVDPQTMEIVVAMRHEMLQKLQNANHSEATEIRDKYQHKLQSILEARARHHCTDC